jgi:cytochrome c oxidase cbb3-type subunit 4
MDITQLRIGVTIVGLLAFLALVAWAWSRHRKADFDAAAALPFLDDAGPAPAGSNPSKPSNRTGGGQA